MAPPGPAGGAYNASKRAPAPQAPSWIKGEGWEGKGKKEGKGEGREKGEGLAPESKFWHRHWRDVHVAYSSVRLSIRKTVLGFG